MRRGTHVAACCSVSTPAVRDWFVADHLLLDTLLEEILIALEAQDADDARALWAGFTQKLLRHMDIEERWLFPYVDERGARGARALHEEHRYLRSRSAGLGDSVATLSARLEEIRGFADELRAHASHEDRMLYAWTDQHLTSDEHAAVLRQIKEMDGKRP